MSEQAERHAFDNEWRARARCTHEWSEWLFVIDHPVLPHDTKYRSCLHCARVETQVVDNGFSVL